MLQAASPALQSGASPLCFAAAAWDARPSRSLNCPPPPPAQPCSGDDLAGFGGSPDGSNRTLTIFRRVSRLENIWGDGITPKAIWHIVKAAAKRAGIKDLAPHDLRRSCHGCVIWRAENLNRFSFCLGMPRFRQRKRYLGCKRNSAKR